MSTTQTIEATNQRRQTDAEVGRRVHMLMWDQGVTQTAFGKLVGIDQSSLAKKLRGQRGWSLDEVRDVAQALRTSVAFLFGESEDPAPRPSGALNPRPTD